MWWGDIKSDAERFCWEFRPLEGVGPLRFGMSHTEVVEVLGSTPMFSGASYCGPLGWAVFSDLELRTLYQQEGLLAGVSVRAGGGPQVMYRGTRLTGRRPSELNPWLDEMANMTQLHITSEGGPAFPELGLVLRGDAWGEYVRSRPLLVAAEWSEGCGDSAEGPVPAEEWDKY
ncbi:hypothetical protein ADK54_09505 [Streptomyces sp. WM6378]|nr:hypothetical protein ADK54_09505 [Streptomyces sp. WM6378]